MIDLDHSGQQFELALLIDGSIDRTIAMSDLLDCIDRGDELPSVRNDHTTLLFRSGGRNWMPTQWVLGGLAGLAGQFGAAAERLRDGRSAVVRCAIDDMPNVDYLLFALSPPEITVSIFHPPAELRFVYPTSPAWGPKLYDYVDAHLDEFSGRALDSENPNDIAGATMPAEQLIEALDLQATLARDVIMRLWPSED